MSIRNFSMLISTPKFFQSIHSKSGEYITFCLDHHHWQSKTKIFRKCNGLRELPLKHIFFSLIVLKIKKKIRVHGSNSDPTGTCSLWRKNFLQVRVRTLDMDFLFNFRNFDILNYVFSMIFPESIEFSKNFFHGL